MQLEQGESSKVLPMISQASPRAPLRSAEAPIRNCRVCISGVVFGTSGTNKAGEETMNDKSFWRGLLIIVLSVVLAKPAEAQAGGGKIVSTGTIVGAIVGTVAAVVVVTVVVIHESSKKRTITGCVSSGENGT